MGLRCSRGLTLSRNVSPCNPLTLATCTDLNISGQPALNAPTSESDHHNGVEMHILKMRCTAFHTASRSAEATIQAQNLPSERPKERSAAMGACGSMANLNIQDLNVCVQRGCEIKGLVPSIVYVEVCSQLLPVQSDCVHSLEGVGPAARRHGSRTSCSQQCLAPLINKSGHPYHQCIKFLAMLVLRQTSDGSHVPARFLISLSPT